MDSTKWLFLLLITGKASDMVVPETGTFQQAVNRCEDKGEYLASASQLAYYSQRSTKHLVLWLPYYKSTSTDYEWIDGTFFAQYIINSVEHEHEDCALVHSSDTYLSESNCFKKGKDYICDINGTSCASGLTCITIDNKKRSVHYDKVSWFEARNRCRNRGGDLAVFRGKSGKDIAQAINANMKVQGHFWIGLRRKPWKFASSGINERYNWTSDISYTDSRLGCATLTSDLSWRTANCSSRYAFMCNGSLPEREFSETTTSSETLDAKTIFTSHHISNAARKTIENTRIKSTTLPVLLNTSNATNTSNTESQLSKAAIIGIAVGGVSVVGVAVVVFVFGMLRCRRRDDENNDVNPKSPEDIPMMQM